MNVYLDENDIFKTLTYETENGKKKKLISHDRDGFVIKSLQDYNKLLISAICDEIGCAIAYEVFVSEKLSHKEVELAIQKVKDNFYGIRD